jgi:protein-disulfide isomerase
VQRDIDEGTRIGVTGTPAFFINGRPLSGAQPLEAFVRVIDEELARTSDLRSGSQ